MVLTVNPKTGARLAENNLHMCMMCMTVCLVGRTYWVCRVMMLCGTVWDRDSLALSGESVLWDKDVLDMSGDGVVFERRCCVGQCGTDSLGDDVVWNSVGQRLAGFVR